VFAPVSGWTSVLWPPHFNIHDIEAAITLSAATDTVISTMHVYDDAYWVHVLTRSGSIVDQFASRPTYFDPAPADADRLRAAFGGNAEVVAREVGVNADALRPYMRHLTDDQTTPVRFLADDEFAADDSWVFVDMWKRMGIVYPEPVSTHSLTVDLGPGWEDQLPVTDGL
jgi:hypothetical protein